VNPPFEIFHSPGEGFFGVWKKRALHLSILSLFTLIGWLGLPFWLLLAAFFDLLTGSIPKFSRVRAVLVLLLSLWVESFAVLWAAWVWIYTLGGRTKSRAEYIKINSRVKNFWMSSLFFGGTYLMGIRLDIEGLEETKNGPFHLWVHHTSSADTVISGALVESRNKIQLRYVLKKELLYLDPCIDIIGRRVLCTYVDRSGSRSKEAIGQVLALAEDLYGDTGVIIYPEGTRFSEAKRQKRIEDLESQGKKELAEMAAKMRHILAPRLGGPLGLLQKAPHADIVFLEHTGLEAMETIGDLFNGALVGVTLHIRFRRIKAENIPEENRDIWIYEQFMEMDEWIESYRGQGFDTV
jgi:1-acyl-sn-glycerol-3-phosphate acyltransferase